MCPPISARLFPVTITCGGRICIRAGDRCVFNPNSNFVRGTDVYSCGGQITEIHSSVTLTAVF